MKRYWFTLLFLLLLASLLGIAAGAGLTDPPVGSWRTGMVEFIRLARSPRPGEAVVRRAPLGSGAGYTSGFV